jgi:hypothetical protein
MKAVTSTTVELAGSVVAAVGCGTTWMTTASPPNVPAVHEAATAPSEETTESADAPAFF